MGRGRGGSYSRVRSQTSPRAQVALTKPVVVFPISTRAQKKLDSIDAKTKLFQIQK